MMIGVVWELQSFGCVYSDIFTQWPFFILHVYARTDSVLTRNKSLFQVHNKLVTHTRASHL